MNESIIQGRPVDEWLKMFYGRVDSELAVARNTIGTTHQWVITLTVGGITAVLAFGQGDFKYPTESSFIAVLVLLPLLFRFFVRACLEYTIFHRWLEIRNLLDRYYYLQELDPAAADSCRTRLLRAIELYYFNESSAKPFLKMVQDNLKLAFLWPFILLIGLIVIGLRLQESSPLIKVVIWGTALFTLLELACFVRYRRFRYKELDEHDAAEP